MGWVGVYRCQGPVPAPSASLAVPPRGLARLRTEAPSELCQHVQGHCPSSSLVNSKAAQPLVGLGPQGFLAVKRGLQPPPALLVLDLIRGCRCPPPWPGQGASTFALPVSVLAWPPIPLLAPGPMGTPHTSPLPLTRHLCLHHPHLGVP